MPRNGCMTCSDSGTDRAICPGTPRRRCRNADSGVAHRSPARSPLARPPPGGPDRTAATLRHCSAVSSPILENQSQNRARSILPLPTVNASRNPVQHIGLQNANKAKRFDLAGAAVWSYGMLQRRSNSNDWYRRRATRHPRQRLARSCVAWCS